MKTKFRISSIALLLVIFFASSCKKDNLRTETAEGSVEFSYGVKSNKSTKAIAKPFAAIVSITDENDQTVVENQELKFYNINRSYLTEKLTLTAGNYKLSHYVIVSQTNEVIYATPLQGSELAYLVNTPLTIDITVAEEQASQTIPEVIEVDDFTADQFGYSYFGLQKVKIFNFAVDLFTKDADTEVLSPVTGTITVTGDAVELFNGQLEAKTNAIYLRDGYTNYTVTVEKEGYTTYTKTFTVDELKAHSNAHGNNPLTVVLDNNSTESVWFTIELPESNDIYLTIGGSSGKNVNINWGDDTEITESTLTIFENFSHSYKDAGTYTVKITGDIKGITKISIEYIHSNYSIKEIDISKAINLQTLECPSANLASLDVSNNTLLKILSCSFNLLESLDLSNNSALEELTCDGNQLSNLVLDNNPELKSLSCKKNQLESLNLSNNTELTHLRLDANQISTLDLSNNLAIERVTCTDNLLNNLYLGNNTSLKDLECTHNQLNEINVNKNTSLEYLSCQENQLKELDLSNNTLLKYVACSYNQLNSLDVSNNNLLETLWCHQNQLTELNLQNGNNTILSRMGIKFNPNLTTVCVDAGFETGNTGWITDENVTYSSTCQ